MVNTFSFPTNISFGPGVLSQLPAYLKEHSLKNPMIVTDEVVKELPFFKNCESRYLAAGRFD